jgi:hypothetical protein
LGVIQLPSATNIDEGLLAPDNVLYVCSFDRGCDLWYLSYGANMSFDTLARRGVKVLQRAPCVLVDSNIKLVFQHRAGARWPWQLLIRWRRSVQVHGFCVGSWQHLQRNLFISSLTLHVAHQDTQAK